MSSHAQSAVAQTTDPVLLWASYQLVFQPDSTAATTQTETIHLQLGRQWSKSESHGKFLLDSAFAAFDAMPETQATTEQIGKFYSNLPRTRFRYTIYKSVSKRRFIWHELINNKAYQYEEPLPTLAWHLTPDTATIAGYRCRRATAPFGGRMFEAWYTTEVPVSDGPYKFHGLPGLIIQVGDTQHHYTFKLVRLVQPATPRVVKLPGKNEATVTTKAQLRQAVSSFEEGVSARLAAMGHAVSAEEQRAYQQRLKSRNNHLERR